MTRPSMRFVPVKEESQQEILAMHRVREMLIRQRTQAINGIRGHLAEFGVVGPRRAHRVKLLVDVIGDGGTPACQWLRGRRCPVSSSSSSWLPKSWHPSTRSAFPSPRRTRPASGS
ncbi:hypothetical protein [Mangrovicoccus ximenensis]|uniref:hypothetical protein n=1 Tax=Mangrovicoccus ximenensis TaxID=1911570 RepID=UPI001F48C62F|nr:hypothetical protein [Mangrovicoccus ximenensis]